MLEPFDVTSVLLPEKPEQRQAGEAGHIFLNFRCKKFGFHTDALIFTRQFL